MSDNREIREKYLRRMAAHVLDNGLTGASLRPLAKAAGTSDRMLIYHFGSKDALIADLLWYIADDMDRKLGAALPNMPMESQRQLLDEFLARVRSPVLGAYVRVWREVTAAAALGQSFHRKIARRMSDGVAGLLAARMPRGEKEPARSAQVMLTLIEGIHVMDAIGEGDTSDAAISAVYPRS